MSTGPARTEIALADIEDEQEPGADEQIDARRRELINALRCCNAKERVLIRALPVHGYQLWRAGNRLGYNKRTIQLMKRRPRFQRALLALHALEDLQCIVSNHQVLREYLLLAHSNLKDFYDEEGNLIPPQQWTEEMGAVVAERSFDERGNPKIKLHEKKGALDALAKYQRMMPDRLELTGKDGQPLNPLQPVLNVVISAKPGPKTPEGE